MEEQEQRAAESFARHVVTEEAPGRWLCARPGTGICHFRVVDLPNAVLVYGDIGDLLLVRGGVAWARGSVYSLDYLLGKSPHRREVKEFYPELAKEAIVDWLEQETITPEQAEALREDWSEGFGEEFDRAVYEVTGDSELCGAGMWWSSEALWCALALRWFCKATSEVLNEEGEAG
jgi:hypothetical protein